MPKGQAGPRSCRRAASWTRLSGCGTAEENTHPPAQPVSQGWLTGWAGGFILDIVAHWFEGARGTADAAGPSSARHRDSTEWASPPRPWRRGR